MAADTGKPQSDSTGGALNEILSRIRCAWHVLRGYSVLRGVSVYHGEVTIYGRNAALSRRSAVDGCEVYAPDMRGLPEMRGKGSSYIEATVSGPGAPSRRHVHDGTGSSWEPLGE